MIPIEFPEQKPINNNQKMKHLLYTVLAGFLIVYGIITAIIYGNEIDDFMTTHSVGASLVLMVFLLIFSMTCFLQTIEWLRNCSPGEHKKNQFKKNQLGIVLVNEITNRVFSQKEDEAN